MVRHDAQRIHVHNGMSTFFKLQKQVHYYKFTKKPNILKFKQIMSAYQKQNLEKIFKFIRNLNKSFVLYAVSQHCLYCIYLYIYLYPFCTGADPAGGAPGARPPPKIGKNMIFWRKIVIFHTKYLKKFRPSLRSAHFFLSAPPVT